MALSSPSLQLNNLFSCRGLAVVVTGGRSGLGLMMTLALSQNGAKVMIVSRKGDKLQDVARVYGQGISGQIIPVQGDVSNKQGIAKLVSDVKEHAPDGVNVLINNVGLSGEGSLDGYVTAENAMQYRDQLWKFDFSEWADLYKMNVVSHYFVTAGFLPLLQKGAETAKHYTSQVVNVASMNGLFKAAPRGEFAYNASKAAKIQGEPDRRLFPSEMTTGHSDPMTHKSEFGDVSKTGNIPAGRTGTDEDMAGTILYLVSRAGLFVNGQLLHPDGGALLVNPSSI